MFRQRGSGYGRRRRPARVLGSWLVALAGCAAAVLGVHYATAPRTLDAASAASVFRAGADGTSPARPGRPGYGRGGYTMMPHATEATAATTMNWSGYASTGAPGSFSSVASSWAQPTVTCDGTDTFSSFWVGLDGVGTPTLEQTGTEADCSGGTAVYGGWYEIFPDAPVFYNEPVQPGDEMSAAVTANGGGSFTLTLSDATRGWQQVTSALVPGAELASAEIIAEAPSGQTVLPLADFGTVQFTNATVNGQAAQDATLIALTLVSGGGAPEATPSALTSSTSFSVTWHSSGAAASGTTGTGATGTGTTGTGTTGTGGTGTTGAGRRHHHRGQHDQG
jgi:Peptidase A4 family